MRCRIITADVMDGLRSLPDESVHCVVTSPPYWGLRDYGVTGQLGLEATPQEFIAKMVEVFGEVRRVLRKDGTCWVNMGDSYAQSTVRHRGGTTGTRGPDWIDNQYSTAVNGLKAKDLCMMPHRLAIALQDSGWWVRSDIVWHKPNPMPESVTDRPTKSHEYVFLLAKSEKYYYDQEAVRESAEFGRREWRGNNLQTVGLNAHNGDYCRVLGGDPSAVRNSRSVWTIATESYAEAHFATFPQALVKPCVLAGTSEKVCAECGAPWVRKVVPGKRAEGGAEYRPGDPNGATTRRATPGGQKEWDARTPGYSLGFAASCTCNAGVVPATVLDIFMGSGTTGVVALQYGRNFSGIEINPEYVALARKRIAPALAQELLPL